MTEITHGMAETAANMLIERLVPRHKLPLSEERWNADGTMWVRSEAEFNDGRFVPAHTAAISTSEKP